MKKLTKIISITMLIAMTLALCACGSTAATTAADSSAPAADTAAPAADSAPASPSNALEQIKADGVLSVALSPDFAREQGRRFRQASGARGRHRQGRGAHDRHGV